MAPLPLQKKNKKNVVALVYFLFYFSHLLFCFFFSDLLDMPSYHRTVILLSSRQIWVTLQFIFVILHFFHSSSRVSYRRTVIPLNVGQIWVMASFPSLAIRNGRGLTFWTCWDFSFFYPFSCSAVMVKNPSGRLNKNMRTVCLSSERSCFEMDIVN